MPRHSRLAHEFANYQETGKYTPPSNTDNILLFMIFYAPIHQILRIVIKSNNLVVLNMQEILKLDSILY